MAIDDVDAGRREGVCSDERREPVELRRRTRVLELGNEIRDSCALPLRASATTSRRNSTGNALRMKREHGRTRTQAVIALACHRVDVFWRGDWTTERGRQHHQLSQAA